MDEATVSGRQGSVARLLLLIVAAMLLLSGCSLDLLNRDGEALDKFSHAYTDFREVGQMSEGALRYYMGREEDEAKFWRTLKGAVSSDENSSDEFHIAMAKSAIDIYDALMLKAMEASADQVQKLDVTVNDLFETAYAIRNPSHREAAISVAKYGRQYEQSIEMIEAQTEETLRLNRQILSEVVRANGNLNNAFRVCEHQLKELESLNQRNEDAGKRLIKAMQNQEDAFSSLKGMTRIKAYPTEFEGSKQGKSP